MKSIFSQGRKQKNVPSKEEERERQLLEELNQAKLNMSDVYTNLAYIEDEDMIDCLIYELKANELRYKLILKKVKEELKAKESRACMAVKKMD